MRLSYLLCALSLTGCFKSIYFTDSQTNNASLAVDGMWVVKTEEAQSIRVRLKKSSSNPVYIDWRNAKIKVGDGAPAAMNVRPNHAISMISSNSAVFEIQPLIEMKSDPSFLYPGEYIANPKSLKNETKKVTIAVEVCSGPIEEGFRAIDCEVGADGWNKTIISGELNFGPLSAAR